MGPGPARCPQLSPRTRPAGLHGNRVRGLSWRFPSTCDSKSGFATSNAVSGPVGLNGPMIESETHPAREALCFSRDPVPEDARGTLLRMQAELPRRLHASLQTPRGGDAPSRTAWVSRANAGCHLRLLLLALGPPPPGGFHLDRLCFSSKRMGGFCPGPTAGSSLHLLYREPSAFPPPNARGRALLAAWALSPSRTDPSPCVAVHPSPRCRL